MQGIVVAEHCHVVNAIPPVDFNGGVSSDVISMRDHARVDFIVQLGVSGGAVPTVKAQACDNFTPSNTTDLAFDYWAETTSNGDTLATKASATTSGLALNTNNGIFYVISVEARNLPAGSPNVRLTFSDSSASTIASCVAVLSGGRNQGDPATRRTQIA